MTISVVSTTKANSLSVTIPATTAHNCIVVCVDSFNTATQSVTGVTIGASADHFAQAVAAGGGISAPLSAIWVDRDCVGGQTAIAISGSNLAVTSSDGGVVVYEIAGLDTASPVDVTHPGTGGGAAWTSGSTATTAQPSEIWVGTAGVAATAAGPGAPWVNTIPTGSFSISGVDIVSSTGTAAYAGTAASGSWSAAVVTLKGAASAVPGTVQPRPTVPVPRRRPTRARILFTPVAGANAAPAPPVPGTVQPAAAAAARRRLPARARILFTPVAGANAAPAPPVPGTVQPRPTVPVPRRRPTRAVARWVAVPGVRAAAPRQMFQTAPRRRRARAVVRFTPVAGANAVTARTLLVSLASAAGVDDYGNAYPQGIFAGAGVIEGPTFVGSDYLSDAAGSFYYSAAPAFGNLISSVAAAAGTDAQGNAYLAGTVSYEPGGTYSAVAITGGAVAWFTAPGAAGPWTEVGVMEIALIAGNPLVFSFNALDGNISIPQSAPFGVPLASPAPSSYNVVWGTQVVTAINNLYSMLQAAGISF